MLADSRSYKLENERFENGKNVESEKKRTYTLKKQIAEGAEGQVWLAEFDSPIKISIQVSNSKMKKNCAIKLFDMEVYRLDTVEHESKLLQECTNQNIVQRIQSFQAVIANHRYYVLVLEYCDKGSLDSYLMYNQHLLKKEEGYAIFAQILKGVQILHIKGIIHRDIKPANILVTTKEDKLVFKISDFGMARKLVEDQEIMKTYVGTRNYMSIEVLKNQPYTIKADLWSLGIILFEILFGTHPFNMSQDPIIEIQKKIRNGFEMPKSLKVPYKPEQAELFRSIFCYEESRIGFDQLLEYPIIQSYITKSSLDELKRFYLERFSRKENRKLSNNIIKEEYEKALDCEFSRVEYLEELREFIQSIYPSTQLEKLIFFAFEAVNACLKYQQNALNDRIVKVYHFAETENLGLFKSMAGYSYIECFFEQDIKKRTGFTMQEVMDSVHFAIKQQRITELLRKLNNKCRQLKTSRLTRMERFRTAEAREVSELNNDPIEYVQEKILPPLRKHFEDARESDLPYLTKLLVNLQVLRLFYTTIAIDLQRKMRIYVDWLDQNHHPRYINHFVEWSYLFEPQCQAIQAKLRNIDRKDAAIKTSTKEPSEVERSSEFSNSGPPPGIHVKPLNGGLRSPLGQTRQ